MLKKNLIVSSIIILALIGILSCQTSSYAAYSWKDVKNFMDVTKGGTGLTLDSVPGVINAILDGVLGLTGLTFVVLVIYGGFIYMTSAGDKDRITKAKKLMIYSILGIAVVILAVAIKNLVVTILTGGASGGGG